MRLLTIRMPKNHNWFLPSDKHTGSLFSSESGWEKFCRMVVKSYDGCKNNAIAELGDIHEAITVDDKRFAADMLNQPRPLEQLRVAERERERIKKYYRVILSGNHDDKLWRFGNLVEDLCNHLGCEYGTYTCKVSVVDDDNNLMYKMFLTHGYGSIRSVADDPVRREANMKLGLKRKLQHKAADCAVMGMGHTHRLMIVPPKRELYLTDDGKRISQHYTKYDQNAPYIHPDNRWYVNTGSFCRLYVEGVSGYAERAGYDPMEIGFPVIRVRDGKIQGIDPIYLDV